MTDEKIKLRAIEVYTQEWTTSTTYLLGFLMMHIFTVVITMKKNMKTTSNAIINMVMITMDKKRMKMKI